MAGNSSRKGATRKAGSKKPRTVGSGGQRSKGLAGRGPTPAATRRPGHPARKRAEPKPRPTRSGVAGGRSGSGHRGGKQRPDLVLGRNPVLEALEVGTPASTLLVQRTIDADKRVSAALARAVELGIPVREMPKADLDQAAGGIPHQGLILQATTHEYADFDHLLRAEGKPGGRLVALDGITDPRNLGAIIRSAAAFGAGGVIVPTRRSAGVTAVVWRASAGAVARVPVAQVTNMTRAIVAAKHHGFIALGLDGDAEVGLGEFDPADSPVMLVVGAEGRGLGRLVGQTCDERIRIQMVGPTQSLNASVAAGIALHALVRPLESAG